MARNRSGIRPELSRSEGRVSASRAEQSEASDSKVAMDFSEKPIVDREAFERKK